MDEYSGRTHKMITMLSRQMRERIKELEGIEKEYKSVQMGNAIKDAGFDPRLWTR